MIEVEVCGFEEGGNDKRVEEEINRGDRNGRGNDERRVKVGGKGDEIGELFAEEGGGTNTAVYVADIQLRGRSRELRKDPTQKNNNVLH